MPKVHFKVLTIQNLPPEIVQVAKKINKKMR